MPDIDKFFGPHRFLSNFWPAKVTLDGVEYPTVEHAYVASKTLDTEKRKEIASVETAGQVKRLGRRLVLRPDWDDVKLSVMENLVRQKFSHADLAKQLRATGDAKLTEGNTWGDTFWGVCRGVGANHLGKILMRIRTEMGA